MAVEEDSQAKIAEEERKRLDSESKESSINGDQ